MEERNIETTEETVAPTKEEPVKPLWQQTKEGWYDKLNVTVKQLDIIIACGIGGLILTAICIALDAIGIF